MKPFHIAAGAFLLAAAGVRSQFVVEPDTPADPNTIQDCTWWHIVASGDTCTGIASSYGLTIQQFRTYNPSQAGTCSLILGNSYCIEQNWGEPPVGTSTSTSTSAATTTTSAGNGVQTPTPTQVGMVGNCNRFHFVVSGDGCASIGSRYGVSLSQLTTWNPAIGATCSSMWLNTYLCVGVIGTTPPPTTTTTPGNGISTPTPIQDGMVGNCNRFHFVVSGDGCASIGSRYGVSLSQLTTWNPAIGSTCTSLWLNTYLCVGVGVSGPTSTTTTSAGNGIATPTPIQDGMTRNCDRFHFVVSGDQCGAIATRYNIPLTNFYTWNPAVGTSCQALWLNVYVCVRTIGFVTPTPTTTGNGISTPTPTQPGMASNCNRFHKVVSGDQCGTIASRYGISLATFYSWNPGAGNACQTLWLDTYYCVGRL